MNQILLCKGHSGMGNRVLALLSSSLYARLSGRQLIIDWNDYVYSDHNLNSFHHFFTCSSAQSILSLPHDCKVYPAIWQDRLATELTDLILKNDPNRRFDFRSILRYSADPGRLDYDAPIVVMCPYRDFLRPMRPLLCGEHAHLRHLSRQRLLRWVWDREFGWSDTVLQRVKETEDQCWHGKMIGVHVRYTDIKIPLPKYFRAVDRLKRKMPDATIFLATDGEGVANEFQKRYGQVVSLSKRTSERRNCGGMHGVGSNRVTHGLDAVADMLLLSKCDYLVYASRSTFAMISHIWSNSTPDKIIDLDRWNPRVQLKRILQDRTRH